MDVLLQRVDLYTFKTMFLSHLDSLMNFQFYLLNPVFWAFLLILFLILAQLWDKKKSFSFCITIAIILLGATKLESYITGAMQRGGEVFDPTIFRIIVSFIVFITILYYASMKQGSEF
ncbi:MAG: hypothetical protein JSW40_03555 [Candidatus Omnitrophota bacterium]|nr:MAG: hypothetical protein JSW40_03555 [Candidatus Omnitrophota bacterium]